MRADIGAISRQAVYDALGTLTDKGLIRRIQPARSPARYEDRVDDNHHHLVCRTCGRTVDVDCAVGSRPCLEAADDHGFAIDEAEVIYWGHCPDCRTARRRHLSSRPPQPPPPSQGAPMTRRHRRHRHHRRSSSALCHVPRVGPRPQRDRVRWRTSTGGRSS